MFFSKPLTTFSCFFILLLVPILVKSQKGFQIGVGFHSMPFNASEYRIEVYNESIYSKTPFGLSLNTDYTFNDKLRIKSGLEYKFQNISFNNITDFRAEFFSIPVILNYNFPKINKYGLTLGLDLGISLDKLSKLLANPRLQNY